MILLVAITTVPSAYAAIVVKVFLIVLTFRNNKMKWKPPDVLASIGQVDETYMFFLFGQIPMIHQEMQHN